MHVLVKAGSQPQVSFHRICHLIRLLGEAEKSAAGIHLCPPPSAGIIMCHLQMGSKD